MSEAQDLLEAAKRGHTDKALAALRAGVDVYTETADGETALCLASEKGHYEICQILLEHFANVNACDPALDSPLHLASGQGHEDIVRLLIKNGADLNVKRVFGHTPLHNASISGHVGVVRCLLGQGAHIKATDNMNNTALHEAAREGHKDVVLCLLRNGANLNQLNDNRKSPAMLAEKWKHLEIVEIVEKYRLYKAALNGDYELCQKLVEGGTTRDLENIFKDTYVFNPAIAALKAGHLKIVNLFLQRKLNVDYENIVSEIPSIFWAIDKGHDEVVSYLLDCGADPNTTFNGDTILHQATHKRRADLVRLLLHKGADPNRKDERGLTPLHYAVINGDEDIVADLLEHDPDVNALTPNRDTPLHLAFAGVRHKIGQLLINKGADIEALNSDNVTPSDILKHKFEEHQRIANMMRQLTEPKNEECACTCNPKTDLVEDELDSGSGYVSDSDATVKYPSLAKLSDFDGLTTEATPVLKSIDVQSLQSNMDELLALVLEIEDMVVDVKLLETDLTREAEVISHLQLKLDNIRLKRVLTKNATESKFEEMSKSLTEKQDEAKRKESEFQNQMTTLQKNIGDLNVKKKIIYQEIGQIL